MGWVARGDGVKLGVGKGVPRVIGRESPGALLCVVVRRSENMYRASWRGRSSAVLVATGIVAMQIAAAPSLGAPIQWSGNEHYYEVVSGATTWQQAHNAAAARTHLGLRGHLVSITSADENLFLTATFGAGALDGRFLGGYQLVGAVEPAGSWRWVTGEAVSFGGWFPGEPNNGGGTGERVMIFAHPVQPWGKGWNDVPENSAGSGYVVEYERVKGWQNLHPLVGVGYSQAIGFYGNQIGTVNDGVRDNASLWNGTAASWVNLNPTGAARSVCNGIHAGTQVGAASFGGQLRAGYWKGTAASWVELHPAGFVASEAKAVHGTEQVGVVYLDSVVTHASLWNGSGASWIDLHPATGAERSFAYGVQGGQQVGSVVTGNFGRASLWTGSAASRVELHPTGATSSVATGIDQGIQVGRATIDGLRRAGLWRGTPESWRSIGPIAASDSQADAASGGFQVGVSWFAGNPHASLWRGTRESWKDLSLMLPATWPATFAQAVWRDGNTLHISGSGVSTADPVGSFAIRWELPICDADFNLDESVDDADFVTFASDYNALICEDAAMTPGCPADINRDGLVDDADFVLFASAYDALVCP